MTLREQLVKRAKKHVTKEVSLKTLSYRITGDSKVFAKLESGKGDVTTSRFEEIMRKFDDLEGEAA